MADQQQKKVIFSDLPPLPMPIPGLPFTPESPDVPQRQRIHNFEMGAGDEVIRGDEDYGLWAGSAVQAVAPFQLGLDGSLSLRTFSQGALPTTAQMRIGEMAFWADTGTGKIYVVVRQAGTIKKVELT